MLTGTHKDRLALAHVLNAIDKDYDTITCGTCGNYGVALAAFASHYGINTVIFVPQRYTNTRINEMRKYNAKIIFFNGTYEETVACSIRYAKDLGVYDANPGGANSNIGIETFKDIASEIVNTLGKEPDVVSVPLGNGTTLAGIYRGFLELYEKNLVNKVPSLIGGTTLGGNQIYTSWINESTTLLYMDKKEIRETWVNEPLVSYESLDGSNALEAIYATNGAVYAFPDKDLLKMRKKLRTYERVTALPASTASILAINRFIHDFNFRGIFVALITGGERIWIRQ